MLSRSRRAPGAPGGITISSSFPGQLPVVRRLLRGEYMAAARRDSQLQRHRARVRGHLCETPGPAAPSPDGATLCGPRKPAFRLVLQLPLAMAGHLVTVSQRSARTSCSNPTAPSPAGANRTRQSRPRRAGDHLAVRRSRCRRRRITSMKRRRRRGRSVSPVSFVYPAAAGRGSTSRQQARSGAPGRCWRFPAASCGRCRYMRPPR